MKGKTIPLKEGCYRSSEGEIFSVANLHEVEDGFSTFELVESDDPENHEAIATDLTSEDWPSVSAELGLEYIEEQTALQESFKRSLEQALAGDTHNVGSLWDDEGDGDQDP